MLELMKDARETKYLIAFGKRLALLRHERGLTQAQVAEKVSVTTLNIGYIEQGRQFPRITTLHDIAKALGVNLMELFRGL